MTTPLAIAPADVRAAAQRALALATTLAGQVDALAATPHDVLATVGLTPDRLAVDLVAVVVELRRDLGSLLALAGALGAAPAELTAVDERLAHAVPLPRADGRAAWLHLPVQLSVATGTLLLEGVLHAAPPETLSVLDPLLARIPDGPGWAVATAPPTSEAASPSSPAGWLGTVAQAQARPGQIQVTHLRNGHWVVSLPGIHDLAEAPDPLDLPGAARAFATGHAGYAGAVVTALTLAGVPKGAQLLLVGHSQGGIVAADLSADSAVAQRWQITHLLTAGSPIGNVKIPADTAVLSLRNRADIVPQLDLGTTRESLRHSIVDFDGERGDMGANHDLAETYVPYAESADFADDPDVQRFRASARDYLAGGPATTQTFQLLDHAPHVPAPQITTTPDRE